MPTLFLLAAIITGILALVFGGFLVAGIVCCCICRFRFIGPYLLFVPPLAAIGAVGGSWGLGYLAHQHDPMSVLPFWGFVVGLPVGGGIGLVLGFSLAFLLSRKISHERV
jgi:hypothetical protein